MEDRIVWCRHHEHVVPLNHKCKVGVDIDKMVPPGKFGRHYMLPCHTSESVGTAKCQCAQRDLFTAAEVKEQDRASEEAMDEAVARLNATAPLIRRLKEKNRQGGQGVENCPVCHKRGGLYWSIAAVNKHIRMRCETPDCINFME